MVPLFVEDSDFLVGKGEVFELGSISEHAQTLYYTIIPTMSTPNPRSYPRTPITENYSSVKKFLSNQPDYSPSAARQQFRDKLLGSGSLTPVDREILLNYCGVGLGSTVVLVVGLGYFFRKTIIKNHPLFQSIMAGVGVFVVARYLLQIPSRMAFGEYLTKSGTYGEDTGSPESHG